MCPVTVICTSVFFPSGNNPVTVCENCKGELSDFCSGNDPYAGYQGAFQCMDSGDGDVAFVRDQTVMSALANSTDRQMVNRVIISTVKPLV